MARTPLSEWDDWIVRVDCMLNPLDDAWGWQVASTIWLLCDCTIRDAKSFVDSRIPWSCEWNGWILNFYSSDTYLLTESIPWILDCTTPNNCLIIRLNTKKNYRLDYPWLHENWNVSFFTKHVRRKECYIVVPDSCALTIHLARQLLTTCDLAPLGAQYSH